MLDYRLNIFTRLLFSFLSILLYDIVVVLFGAPVFEQQERTLLLSSVLTFFTFFIPLFMTKGSLNTLFTNYYNPKTSKDRFIARTCISTLIFTWLSSSLVILDWDKWWQEWPFPPLIGSIVGYFLDALKFLNDHRFLYDFSWVDLTDEQTSNMYVEILTTLPTFSLIQKSIKDPSFAYGEESPIYNLILTSLKITSEFCNIGALNNFSGGEVESVSSVLELVESSKLADFYSFKTSSANLLKVKDKKVHEVIQMSEFLNQFATDKLPVQKIAINHEPSFHSRSFQTRKFRSDFTQDKTSLLHKYKYDRNKPHAFVDIGSGLGHLTRAILRSVTPESREIIKILALESDLYLHKKSETIFDENIERIQFHLTRYNLEEAIKDINSRLDYTYIITGLHCCGDLSLLTMDLFLKDPNASKLTLLSCCYHKVKSYQFPLSNCVSNHAIAFQKPYLTTHMLRLACQWSPSQWFKWTTKDFRMHQLRTFVRLILNKVTTPLTKDAFRIDPCIILKDSRLESFLSDDKISSFPSECLKLHWEKLNIPIDEMECITSQQESRQLWSAIPALLALQQIMQPALEALILYDRVEYLRQNLNPPSKVGLLRLFNPLKSPRCLAIVAQK